MKEIITDENLLSQISEEVNVRKFKKDGLDKVILELKEVIREKNLKALSAPQIGYNKRIVVVKYGENDLRTYVNPIIRETSGFELSKEKCSSIPNKEFIRPRPNNVTVTYQTPMGQIKTEKLVGIAAITMLHQLDHLDGMLLSDVGLEVDEDFYNATDEERAEVLSEYIKSLDIKVKDLDQQIQDDPELKKMNDAIEFMKEVQSGDTKVEYVKVKVKDEDKDEKPENEVSITEIKKKRGRPKKNKEEE